MVIKPKLGVSFKYLSFSPLFGEDSHFDSYFSDGLKPPTRKKSRVYEHPLQGFPIVKGGMIPIYPKIQKHF